MTKSILISIINIILIVAIVALLGLYLIQITTSVQENFSLQQIDNKINSLRAETQKLEIRVADLSSLKRIQAIAEKNQMIDMTDIGYINILSSEVAKAQ